MTNKPTYEDLEQEIKFLRQSLEEKNNDEKFASYFENNKANMLQIDPVTKQIIDASISAVTFYGYSKTELLQKTIYDLHTLSTDEVNAKMKRALKNKSNSFEFRHRIANGLIKDVKVYASTIKFDNDTQIIVSIIDITEKKQTEQALLESEERFKKLSDLTFEGILIHHNGVAIDANQSLLNIFGYSREKIIGNNLIELVVTKEYHATIKENIIKNIAKPYEVIAVKKDGTLFPIELEARNIVNKGQTYRVAAIRDITERKKAEKALFESEKRFKLLFENAPLSYQSLNAKACLIDVNPAWLKTLGYKRDEVIGRPFSDFMTPNSAKLIMSRFAEFVKKGEIHDHQFEMLRKDGTHVHVSFEGKVGYNEFGSFDKTHCIFIDITEQNKVQEALQISEKRFDLAMKASKDGIYDWNLVTNQIYYSPGWKSMLGYTNDELPNNFSIWENLTEPEDVEKSWKMQQEVINKLRDRFEMEFKMKHKNGHWVDILSRAEAVFDKDDKAIRIVGTHVDISERKKAEMELLDAKEKAEESEEKFRDMANLLPQLVFEINLTGEIIYVNHQIFSMFGYNETELLGNNSSVLQVPEERDRFKKNIETKLSGVQDEDREYMMIRKDGTVFPALIFASVITNKNRPVGLRGIAIDISPQKKAEEELISAKEKAEESDRLKSAFLANMSHEIRTPMNGILGFAELLKEPNLSGEKQQKYIDIIEQGGARMLNIINDIVSISKIESGQMEVNMQDSNINKQIEYIYTFFKPEIEQKGIVFSFNNSLTSVDATITTDREKVYAVLTNLVKNAIKYSKKGSIEIGYNIVSRNKSQHLEFFVKDTGIGIPKNRQKAIFERFIQADINDKNAYQGAGLGLAISKAYVEMLDGKIWVKSEVNTGSTFYFTLPYQSKNTNLSNAISEKINTFDTSLVNKLKILIVEDDETSEELISITVKKIGKDIISVNSGEEAVKACHNNPDIDLILMDIRMPKMDGHEATRRIRKFNKDVIIIAQTAYALSGDKEKAIAAGCDDYITKPIDKNELIEMIIKHVNK